MNEKMVQINEDYKELQEILKSRNIDSHMTTTMIVTEENSNVNEKIDFKDFLPVNENEMKKKNKDLIKKSNRLVNNYNKLKDRVGKLEFENKQLRSQKGLKNLDHSDEIFMKCLNDVRKDIIKRKVSSN